MTTEQDVSEKRDTIFIGKKPIMAYVTSTLIQLANLPSVRIKARGMSIGRAVDVAQIISRKTENVGYTIGQIQIGSEALESQDGRTRNVSTIEIEVKNSLLAFFSFYFEYFFSKLLNFVSSTISLN